MESLLMTTKTQNKLEPVHVMVDLETLGTKSDAAILALGAIVFVCEGDKPRIVEEFYETVDIESSIKHGSISGDTLKWWILQTDNAKKELAAKGITIKQCMKKFRCFVGKYNSSNIRDFYIWGNGAAFDNVVIKSCMESLEIDVPWTHKQDMCFRTIKNLYPEMIIKPPADKAHIAIEDTRAQVETLFNILKKLGRL